VWVRDNIHVAHAHYVCGDKITAARNLAALMAYFEKHQERFRKIIEDGDPKKLEKLAADPMNRPHIRFDGRKLEEIRQKWGHAQNDALGYFLWCYCKLAREGVLRPDHSHLKCLVNFLLYFEAIQYWRDADSGHWEEAQKVSASSIGTVVAGLREFELLLKTNPDWDGLVATDFKLDADRRQKLRAAGEAALKQILPCESVEPEKYYRRYDGALLFLVYPLEVLTGEAAQAVLADIQNHLQGDYGIRRYLGDSYWFPDYKEYIPKWKRTGDFSGGMEKRDAHIRLGQEAQWCIFDPIMSVIYGRMHLHCQQAGQAEAAAECLQRQTVYFNRSLRQLTIKSQTEPGHRAPEAYYLEDGSYVPNDHTPLLWTQANLWLAVNQMQQSAGNIEAQKIKC
jgi:phosphorylase kinase alpha/beta subunit